MRAILVVNLAEPFRDRAKPGIEICVSPKIERVIPTGRAEETSMDDSSQPHDPRDDEEPFVRWAPLYVPVFAALLIVLMMLIEADVA
jgi:hypothetical protein